MTLEFWNRGANVHVDLGSKSLDRQDYLGPEVLRYQMCLFEVPKTYFQFENFDRTASYFGALKNLT